MNIIITSEEMSNNDNINNFCNNCKSLNHTEIEQENKNNHMCNKYNTRVYHMGHQPNLIKCEECLNDE